MGAGPAFVAPGPHPLAMSRASLAYQDWPSGGQGAMGEPRKPWPAMRKTMTIPAHTDQQLLLLYADIRSADALSGELMRRNVDTRIKNIRSFTILPDGADAQIEAVRHQVAALALAFQKFGPTDGAAEMIRGNALAAVDVLGKTLDRAEPNERARALGF